jgi:hypothetical protein
LFHEGYALTLMGDDGGALGHPSSQPLGHNESRSIVVPISGADTDDENGFGFHGTGTAFATS